VPLQALPSSLYRALLVLSLRATGNAAMYVVVALVSSSSNNIATSGHENAQIPHSSHKSRNMDAFLFTSPMIPTGQARRQIPHPVHFITSTSGIMLKASFFSRVSCFFY
jgi:hypothetical protein